MDWGWITGAISGGSSLPRHFHGIRIGFDVIVAEIGKAVDGLGESRKGTINSNCRQSRSHNRFFCFFYLGN